MTALDINEEVLAIARQGAAMGCHEALFTLGEAPEDRYPQAAEWLAAHGYATTVDYLVAMAKLVVEETGLLPHANPGALGEAELSALRRWSPSQGMMIETSIFSRSGAAPPWPAASRAIPSCAERAPTAILPTLETPHPAP